MKKTCAKCKEEKLLTDYRNSCKGLDKKQSYCRKCQNAAVRKWENTHKDKAKQNSKDYSQTINGRYLYCIRTSKKRKIAFSLTKSQFTELINKLCHYCVGMFPGTNTCYGIDRKNNLLGYTYENCLPCCGTCNKIKNNFLSVEETEVAVKAIMKLRNWSKSP